eukprot:3238611-Rhodomonas_salina.2
MFELDIVDMAILSVGIAMLPLLPDLLSNLLIAFLPDSWITSRVRSLSKKIRDVSTQVVTRVLVFVSIVGPILALYFQQEMIGFRGINPWTLEWCIHVSLCWLLFFIVQCLYCWTLFSDPGFVPIPPDGAEAPEEKTKFCKKCKVIKPPRAHHCSVCGRCVLRMDHHCPFTNCCVGLLNERFFCGWVLTVCAGAGYGSYLSWLPFHRCVLTGMLQGVDSLTPVDLERCTVMGKACFLFLPAFCVFAFLCILGGWHLLLVATNQTTIEFLRYRLGPLLGSGEKPSEDIPSFGSTSVLQNFRAVLFPKREAVD